MLFKSIIRSNHDLKKNGYKIVRKLHKLEKRANLARVYSFTTNGDCYVYLCFRGLEDILTAEYGSYDNTYIRSFLEFTHDFSNYLECITKSNSRISSARLASYLSAYTEFFNRISDENIPFQVNDVILAKWNIGCIMAYTAVWGNR